MGKEDTARVFGMGGFWKTLLGGWELFELMDRNLDSTIADEDFGFMLRGVMHAARASKAS